MLQSAQPPVSPVAPKGLRIIVPCADGRSVNWYLPRTAATSQPTKPMQPSCTSFAGQTPPHPRSQVVEAGVGAAIILVNALLAVIFMWLVVRDYEWVHKAAKAAKSRTWWSCRGCSAGVGGPLGCAPAVRAALRACWLGLRGRSVHYLHSNRVLPRAARDERGTGGAGGSSGCMGSGCMGIGSCGVIGGTCRTGTAVAAVQAGWLPDHVQVAHTGGREPEPGVQVGLAPPAVALEVGDTAAVAAAVVRVA